MPNNGSNIIYATRNWGNGERVNEDKNYDTRNGLYFTVSIDKDGNNVDKYINTILHELFVHTERDLKTLNSINNDLDRGVIKTGIQEYQLRLNGFINADNDHDRLGIGQATNYRTAATQIDLIRKLSYQLKRYNEDVQQYK